MDDLISRQAAIDALERIFNRCEEIEAHLPDGDPDKTGYKMFPDYMTVWKYLRQLQSVQPEHPESAKEYCAECDHIEMCRWHPYEGCEFRSLPSAERHGRWIDLQCDQCGQVDMSKPNYCPNCGAKMNGEQNG